MSRLQRLGKQFTLAFALSILGSVLLLGLSVRPTYAWTHELNHWDTNHNDYACGYSTSVPCLYWPEPNHVSSTVYAFLDSSLDSVGGYDFRPSVTGAFTNFNNVQGAFNPYTYACYSAGCGSVSYSIGDLGYGVYGQTDVSNFGAVQYASGQYYAFFQGATVQFNDSYWILWNNNLSYSATSADGRKVATHETGHMQGLGHTGHSPAIMQQGAVPYYALQSDDVNGLQSFYTGYIPA